MVSEKRITGEYILESFIPKALPPANPHLQIDNRMMELYGQAMLKLGSLKEMVSRIPDQERFLKAYILKEAILTSEIEGIHTTMLEVLSLPYGIATNNKDSQLVINYSQALEQAIKRIRDEDMPVVASVLQEAHALLLAGEGDHSHPGAFRRLPVRVGSLIPPPANQVADLISALVKFINDDTSLPPLIKAGLAHVQFETIHPFLDGNGRIGRLLIILMLVKDKLLTEPLLYPSYFFKKYHAEYYARLDGVRANGDFEGWIEYYLKAIAESAEDATNKAHQIEQLEQTLHNAIKSSGLFIRSTHEAQEFLSYLFRHPVISIPETADNLGKPYNTIKTLVMKFEQLNMLHKHSEAQRNKTYKFSKYIELLA